MADRRVSVALDLKNAGYITGLAASAAATRAFAHDVDDAGDHIVSLSTEFRSVASRLKLALDVFGAIGPAAVPIAAVAVPAVSGLANALGVAALSGGTAILAFKGVGDALTKVNKANINPTVTNIKNARIAMEQLGHEGRVMVRTLASLKDEFQGLRDAAREGLFPGVDEAIKSLATRIPEVEVILKRIGEVTGDMLAKGADSLASEKWDDFFLFLHNDVPKAIEGLAQATGSLIHAFAELWIASTPLNNGFTDWLISSSAAFDEWATRMADTNGFSDFVAYIDETGPMVADLLGAIALAVLDIAEAGAPIGTALLPILSGLFKVISAIADSDLGTPLLGLLALTKAMALLDRAVRTGPAMAIRGLSTDLQTMAATSSSMTRKAAADTRFMSNSQVMAWRQATQETGKYNAAAERTRATIGRFAKSGAVVAGLALATSGVADQFHVMNTVMGASIGMMAGWEGALVGGGIGALLDLAAAGHQSTLSIEALTDAMNEQTGALSLAGFNEISTELQFFQEGLDAAGISLADATGAVAAGGPQLKGVLDQLSSAYDALMPKQKEATTDAEALANGLELQRAMAQPAAVAIRALQGALQDSNSKVNEAATAFEAKEAAQEAAAAADRQATGDLDKFNEAIDRTLGGLAALNGLLTERDLTLANNKAWLELNKSVKENGEVWDKTSKKGIENNEKLNATVATSIKRVEFLRKQNRDAAAQSMLDKALDDLRTFIRQHPKAAGAARDLMRALKRADEASLFTRALADLHKFKRLNPDAANDVDKLIRKLKEADGKGSLQQALADLREFKRENPKAAASVQPLIDKLVEANKKKVKPKIDVDTDSALNKLGRFQAAVDNLHGNTIVIRTEHMDVRLEKKAAGGPVKAGQPYIVGEYRPELFVPTTSGRILSSVPSRTALGGGGASTGSDGGGKGSDSGGKPLLMKIIEAMLGGGFGPGMLRHFEKMLNQIQRGLTKHHGKWTKELKEQAHDLFKEIREAEKDRAQAIRQAFKSFEGDLSEGAQSIREEVSQLKHDLREAGGVWNKALSRHAQRILMLSRAYDRQASLLEEQQTALEDLNAAAEQTAQEMASFIEQVTGNFSNDPFNTSQGLAGVMAQLTTDTTRATAFDSVLEQLKAMGLDGPAYEALAASGDLVTAQQLLDSGMIDPFEQAFAERTAALNTLGENAAETVFGQQVATQNAAIEAQTRLIAQTEKTMADLQAVVVQQEATLKDLVGLNQRVRNGSYNGTYDGVKDAMIGAGRAMTRNSA